MKLTRPSFTRPSFACVRKYPARPDAGRAFTAALKLVLAQDVKAVDAAAMSNMLLDEQAAREHIAAVTRRYGQAGGRATIKSHGEQLGNGGRESSSANEDTATGRLEVTCIECKASLLVTTHARLQPGKRVTNQFYIKKSMHKQTCSLYMEPAKMAAMVKLPSKGEKITISKNTFEVKAI